MSAHRCPAYAIGSAIESAIKAENPSYTVERWYDESNASYPRIVIGRIEWISDDTKTTHGYRVDIPIAIYSQSKLTAEISGIADNLLAATTESLSIDDEWSFIVAESGGTIETGWSNEIGPVHRMDIRLSIWVEDAS